MFRKEAFTLSIAVRIFNRQEVSFQITGGIYKYIAHFLVAQATKGLIYFLS